MTYDYQGICQGTAGISIFLFTCLISARVIAIWERNPWIVGLASLAALTQLAIYIYAIYIQAGCGAPGPSRTSIVLATLCDVVVDATLLLTALVGLYRWKGAQAYGLWQLLWNQCIIWMLFATLAHTLPAVFAILNLNAVMDLMFLPLELLVVSIVATRIYRSLSGYTHHNVEMSSKEIWQASPPIILRSRMEESRGVPMHPISIQALENT